MKNVVLFTLFLLAACNKNDDGPGFHWGDVSAIKNGDFWEADIYAANNKPYSQGIDILIEKFNDKGYTKEDLHIYKIPMEIGRFNLDSTEVRDIDSLVGCQYFTSIDNGHVAEANYILILDDSIPDFIEITKIDGKEIWGSFQMSLVKLASTEPDTLEFLDGKFHTRLIEE